MTPDFPNLRHSDTEPEIDPADTLGQHDPWDEVADDLLPDTPPALASPPAHNRSATRHSDIQGAKHLRRADRHRRRVTRRELLVGAAAVASGAFWTTTSAILPNDNPEATDTTSQPGPAALPPFPPADPLPAREHLVIRNAHVLTMDPNLGDLPRGDVHVRDGEIIAVGARLTADGASEINGRGTIVLPGLIDTHRHLWATLGRAMAATTLDTATTTLPQRLSRALTPQEMAAGVRLGLIEALSSGITTVHDWADNLRGPKFTDAALQAHTEIGLRGRFSYGPQQGLRADYPIDLEELQRVHQEWFADPERTGGRLHLGLAGRPPGQVPPEVYRAEYATARELELPLSYHVAATPQQATMQMVETLAAERMLGPTTQLVHAIHTSDRDHAHIANAGASVSLSPWSALLAGYGAPPVTDLLATGVRVTLGVDSASIVGAGDLHSVMRLALGMGRGQRESPFGLSARRVLGMATIDAAHSLGLGEVTGSLTPGKRADLITVRCDQPHMTPVIRDAASMLVLAAQPADVREVMVDGRLLKRAGRLTLDPAETMQAASAALRGLQGRT